MTARTVDRFAPRLSAILLMLGILASVAWAGSLIWALVEIVRSV